MEPFTDVISTVEELRKNIPSPRPLMAAKVIDHIDTGSRAFIAASPFVVIASRGGSGSLDLSPKGDPAGFVNVLDDKTLAIPDRPGNNRADTFLNILEDPHVALIFLVPGLGHTLRITGKALIVGDHGLLERMAVDGKLPRLALVIKVEEVMAHCAKCISRSHLWQPALWPQTTQVPSLAEITLAHTRSTVPLDVLEGHIEKSLRDDLY